MKVKSESEVAQLCPTLSDPMDCSLPGSSTYEIFQARVLEWGAIAFSDSPFLANSKYDWSCHVHKVHKHSLQDIITSLMNFPPTLSFHPS